MVMNREGRGEGREGQRGGLIRLEKRVAPSGYEREREESGSMD